MSLIDQHGKSASSTIKDLASTIAAVWRSACLHDGVDPASMFVVFSDANPYVPFHAKALQQYHEALSQATSLGYVGLELKHGKASWR